MTGGETARVSGTDSYIEMYDGTPEPHPLTGPDKGAARASAATRTALAARQLMRNPGVGREAGEAVVRCWDDRLLLRRVARLEQHPSGDYPRIQKNRLRFRETAIRHRFNARSMGEYRPSSKRASLASCARSDGPREEVDGVRPSRRRAGSVTAVWSHMGSDPEEPCVMPSSA